MCATPTKVTQSLFLKISKSLLLYLLFISIISVYHTVSLSLTCICIYVSLQEFISRQVSSQPDHSFWIGLSRRQTEEQWLWDDGSMLLSNL